MNRHTTLSRLVQLSAKLDDAIAFYTPNESAVRAAIAQMRPGMIRGQWKTTFRHARFTMPKPAEKITGVTVKASNGKIYTSEQPFHPMAAENLRKERPKDYDWLARVPNRAERAKGFRTTAQTHITRGEATALARRKGWKPPVQDWRRRAAPGLHGGDLRDVP